MALCDLTEVNLVPRVFVLLDQRSENESFGSNHFEITEFCPSGFTAQSASMAHARRTPEMVAPRALFFRPLVKGNEDSGDEIAPECTGRVNCVGVDKVNFQYTSGALPVSLNILKETRFFIKSSLFQRITIKANVESIAHIPFSKSRFFQKITNFLIFWNSLKI